MNTNNLFPKGNCGAFFKGETFDENAEFAHPDAVFSYWIQAYLRNGDHGKKSLLVLDASDYGGHHQCELVTLPCLLDLSLYYLKRLYSNTKYLKNNLML